MMTMAPEIVLVHRGFPVDPSVPMWPCTVHDLESRRCRYQVANKHLLDLIDASGTAKFMASWVPEAGSNGRWQLIDIVEETYARRA